MTGRSVSLLAALAFCAVTLAASPADSDLVRLLDRWADNAPPDRLTRAVEAARASLATSGQSTAAVVTRLLLARLELARGEVAHAASTAKLARENSKLTRDERAEALTLELLALLGVCQAIGESQARGRVETQVRLVEASLYETLSPAAGSDMIRLERRRVAELESLDLLGTRPGFFDFVALDGGRVTSASLCGKVVLIELWNTRCKASEADLATVQEVYARHRGNGLEVVRVSFDEDAEALRAFLAGRRVPWHECHVETGAAAVLGSWSTRALPRRYLLDKAGRIRFVDRWGSDLDPAVRELLDRR